MKDDPRFARRTSLNLITEILCVVLTTVIGLVMVPYYIDQLGISAYAVVPLATSVSAYMIIVANCFANAINRYFLVALEQDDGRDANKVYSTSLMLMFMICAVLLPATAVISYFCPVIFNVPEGSYDSVRLLFLCEFWSSIFLNFGTCFNNILVVFNKTYVINGLRSTYLGLQIAGTVGMFFVFGPRLEFIGYSYMVGIAVYVLLSYIIMKRYFPDLRFSRADSSRGTMADLGKLAVWAAMVKIGNMMFLQASLILTNLFLGSEIQGGFSLVVSMVSMVGTACNAVTNIFTPFYYRYYAEKDYDSLVAVALLGIKALSLVIALPLAYVCTFSPEIFTFWVGGEYVYLQDTVWVMFVLLIFNAVSGVIDVIPTVMLKVAQAAAITAVTGALNIVLALVFLNFTDWGIIGVAVAYTVSMTVRNGVILPVFIAMILGKDGITFVKPMLWGFALFLIALGFTYAVSLVWDVQGTFLSILVSFLAMFFVFSIIAFRFGLRRSEKDMLAQALPEKLSRILVKVF